MNEPPLATERAAAQVSTDGQKKAAAAKPALTNPPKGNKATLQKRFQRLEPAALPTASVSIGGSAMMKNVVVKASSIEPTGPILSDTGHPRVAGVDAATTIPSTFEAGSSTRVKPETESACIVSLHHSAATSQSDDLDSTAVSTHLDAVEVINLDERASSQFDSESATDSGLTLSSGAPNASDIRWLPTIAISLSGPCTPEDISPSETSPNSKRNSSDAEDVRAIGVEMLSSEAPWQSVTGMTIPGVERRVAEEKEMRFDTQSLSYDDSPSAPDIESPSNPLLASHSELQHIAELPASHVVEGIASCTNSVRDNVPSAVDAEKNADASLSDLLIAGQQYGGAGHHMPSSPSLTDRDFGVDTGGSTELEAIALSEWSPSISNTSRGAQARIAFDLEQARLKDASEMLSNAELKAEERELLPSRIQTKVLPPGASSGSVKGSASSSRTIGSSILDRPMAENSQTAAGAKASTPNPWPSTGTASNPTYKGADQRNEDGAGIAKFQDGDSAAGRTNSRACASSGVSDILQSSSREGGVAPSRRFARIDSNAVKAVVSPRRVLRQPITNPISTLRPDHKAQPVNLQAGAQSPPACRTIKHAGSLLDCQFDPTSCLGVSGSVSTPVPRQIPVAAHGAASPPRTATVCLNSVSGAPGSPRLAMAVAAAAAAATSALHPSGPAYLPSGPSRQSSPSSRWMMVASPPQTPRSSAVGPQIGSICRSVSVPHASSSSIARHTSHCDENSASYASHAPACAHSPRRIAPRIARRVHESAGQTTGRFQLAHVSVPQAWTSNATKA